MKGKMVCLMALLVNLVIACNQSTPAGQQTKTHNDTPALAQETTTPDFKDDVPSDSLLLPDMYDTSFTARIITAGGFHGDEVWDDAEADQWFGLFKATDKYYIAATPVRVNKVYDVVLDEDSTREITGREVSVENNDTCLLLMSRLGNLIQERSVNTAPLSVNKLQPGEKISIGYNNISYILSATGESRKEESGTEIRNYRLYLTTTKNGTTIKQLLVATPTFDDAITTLVFAGDIDGDGMLDLIIDTSNHYNVTAPTLYLSKPAETGKLLKIVALHLSVGC